MSSGGFDGREQAMEKNQAQEEETRFRHAAQAVRLFAQWAAGQMSLKDAAARKYTESLADLHVSKKGLQHVIAKVRADLAASGVAMTEHHLENQFNLHLGEAKKSPGK